MKETRKPNCFHAESNVLCLKFSSKTLKFNTNLIQIQFGIQISISNINFLAFSQVNKKVNKKVNNILIGDILRSQNGETNHNVIVFLEEIYLYSKFLYSGSLCVERQRAEALMSIWSVIGSM